jgi:hypothetical protein
MQKLISPSGCQSTNRIGPFENIHAYVDLRITATRAQPSRCAVNDVSDVTSISIRQLSPVQIDDAVEHFQQSSAAKKSN